MIQRQLPLSRTLLLFTLFAALGTPGLRSEETKFEGEPMGFVAVPAGLTVDEVRTTIALALAQRAWTVTSKADTHVVGYLNHRRHEVTLTVTVDLERIELYSDGWALDRRGNRTKRDPAEGWAENIKKDLNKMLQVAAATK